MHYLGPLCYPWCEYHDQFGKLSCFGRHDDDNHIDQHVEQRNQHEQDATHQCKQPYEDLCEFFLVPHLNVTPLNPFPLVTPITSIISSCPNTELTDSVFSRCSLAQSTLSAMVPPLICNSMM